MEASLVRRLGAEAIGTALLIVFGPGSVVAALAVGKGSLDYAGLGVIGLSFGLVVAIVVHAFGTTSGAHINPAVTVVLAATRRFPWAEVLPYVCAQLAGSVMGGLLVVATFGRSSVEVSHAGSVGFGPGVGYGRAILVEAVATFLLVLAIMAVAVDERAPAGWAPLVIGLSVTSLVVVFGPLTGAAVNPARALGPFAASAVVGGGAPWGQLGAYVVGSLLGGLAAAFGYDAVARPRDAAGGAAPAAEPPQGTQGDIQGHRIAPGGPGRSGEELDGDDVRARRRG